MEVGYNFWQGDFKKMKNYYLDQDFIKPSIEVLTPRSRVYNMLDRGHVKPSIEPLMNPQSKVKNMLNRGLKKTSIEHL